jgi:copper chaperone CopZ
MHCDVCIKKIQGVCATIPGIDSFSLNPPLQQLSLWSKTEPDIDKINRLLRATGGYSIQNPVVIFSTWEKVRGSLAPAIALFIAGLFAFFRGYADGGLSALSLAGFQIDFLGAVFVIFGFAKMGSWRGFVEVFRLTDSLGSRLKRYAQIYPLLELGVGVAYLMRWQVARIHYVAFATLLFTIIGSIGPLRRKERLNSPCLGTLFQVRHTFVILIGYIALAVMILTIGR